MSHSNQRNFDEWEIIREELLGLIRSNNMKKFGLMRKGVYLLVSIHDEIPEAAPLNYTDRLKFIESNIERHVAFIQLDELFKESKKKIARIRAQNKNG
ncbi:hypothetical protein KD050_19590 [Psychrobacillus sp. INOP01]|uniref:YpoC family protein n=1 Tax=Psychrobacillus sp. INOP01 TaxID=2829187 RepID=UPI001BA5D680|nr:hypothetical protein [Psychrobacillus sp. INOP01]QUG41451.1 hypothetical protein KD050_19590 [Psychrobacillus sp. INOP01]